MPILRFDEDALVGRLAGLSVSGRAVFAASCAARLVPVYRWVHGRTGDGEPVALERAMDVLWSSILDAQLDDLAVHGESVEALILSEDETTSADAPYSQHAAAAVVYAIRCRQTHDARSAAWAARQVYEALDFWIANRDDVDFNSPDAEDRVVADPLIQAELGRQLRDLDDLADPSDTLRDVTSMLRRRADAEGRTLFGINM